MDKGSSDGRGEEITRHHDKNVEKDKKYRGSEPTCKEQEEKKVWRRDKEMGGRRREKERIREGDNE